MDKAKLDLGEITSKELQANKAKVADKKVAQTFASSLSKVATKAIIHPKIQDRITKI